MIFCFSSYHQQCDLRAWPVLVKLFLEQLPYKLICSAVYGVQEFTCLGHVSAMCCKLADLDSRAVCMEEWYRYWDSDRCTHAHTSSCKIHI